MSASHFRRVAAVTAAIWLGAFALNLQAEPSNKWRIELNHITDNDGSITFRITPVGGTPIDVETKVPAKTSENYVAKMIRDSLRASLGKAYHVETDDGEDVLIQRRGNTPNFELSLVSSSLTGLEVKLKRE
jgi:hypothetical protein